MHLRGIALAIAATAWVGCTTHRQTVPRLRSSLASMERLAVGTRLPLADAQMFVPDGYEPPPSGDVPLFIHFQGGTTIAEENFVRMRRPGVLIGSTLRGRSSAFSKPYQDPAAFRQLLTSAEQRLSQMWDRKVRLGPLTITFFSAGYGAVRELLKEPEFFVRIETLISADSIYASIVHDDVRAPIAEHMIDFMRFAQAAARGDKTFVLAHGIYETDYASTAECADLILASINGERVTSAAHTDRGVPIASEYHQRGCHVYTFDEATAGIHVDCLYMIPDLYRRHAPR